jgi:hypothetical protein
MSVDKKYFFDLIIGILIYKISSIKENSREFFLKLLISYNHFIILFIITLMYKFVNCNITKKLNY